MKMGDKENPHKFASKPKRRLLDWPDDSTSGNTRSDFTYHSDNTYIIFIVVFVAIVLIAALIKCCMTLSEGADDTDAYNSNPIVHPPPRNHFIPSQRTYSRPLAPPMTNSRSLILLPEEGIFQPFHIGIENPNYVPTNSATDPVPPYASNQPEKSYNHNPTTSSDLPPSYDTVLIEDMLNDAGGIASAAVAQNSSTSTVLPKYEDSRY